MPINKQRETSKILRIAIEKVAKLAGCDTKDVLLQLVQADEMGFAFKVFVKYKNFGNQYMGGENKWFLYHLYGYETPNMTFKIKGALPMVPFIAAPVPFADFWNEVAPVLDNLFERLMNEYRTDYANIRIAIMVNTADETGKELEFISYDGHEQREILTYEKIFGESMPEEEPENTEEEKETENITE